MLVYVEYRSRNPGIELATFHAIVGRRTDAWTDSYPEDELLLNVGRTWRLGPEPEYLVAYYSPNYGLERLEEWERIFKSGDADRLEAQTRATGRIDMAGCFVALTEPVAARGGRYYTEFFDIAAGRSRADVAELFATRKTKHAEFTLHLVADRIGHLGPEPRGLAVWGIPRYAALADIVEELEEAQGPIVLQQAGLYADIGDEIL